MNKPDNLIIVPGHAAFKADITAFPLDYNSDNPWVLQSFQSGEPPYYIQHIQSGIDAAIEDPNSALIFSGGFSRDEAGYWSEAGTYYAIARHLMSDQSKEHILANTFIEDKALDSYQNVDESVELFAQLFGKYPLNTMVIGWGFKQARFEFHAQTIGIGALFNYFARNDPSGEDLTYAIEKEELTLREFMRFPRGDGGLLLEKRNARDFSSRRQGRNGVPFLPTNQSF
jgi:hypothetical protein